MLRQAILPTPNAVASGQTSTFDLDLGKRYHAIWLQITQGGTISKTSLADVADALITQIRVKVNGKVQRTMKGGELHNINALMGSVYGAKTKASISSNFASTNVFYIPIWFAEPWRKNNAEVPLTAWNAAGIDSLQLEVELASLTTPAITGWYEYDAPTGGMGAIVKWIRQTFGASGSVQDFNSISKLDWLQSIHLWPVDESGTTKIVNKIKFTANNNIIRDLLTRRQNDMLLVGRDMNPALLDSTSAATALASGIFHLVFDYDDPVNSALNANGLNEMTLHVEYADKDEAASTATGSLVSIIQRTGPPE